MLIGLTAKVMYDSIGLLQSIMFLKPMTKWLRGSRSQLGSNPSSTCSF